MYPYSSILSCTCPVSQLETVTIGLSLEYFWNKFCGTHSWPRAKTIFLFLMKPYLFVTGEGGKEIERERDREGEGFSLSISFIPFECLPGFFVVNCLPFGRRSSYTAPSAAIKSTISSSKSEIFFVMFYLQWLLLRSQQDSSLISSSSSWGGSDLERKRSSSSFETTRTSRKKQSMNDDDDRCWWYCRLLSQECYCVQTVMMTANFIIHEKRKEKRREEKRQHVFS